MFSRKQEYYRSYPLNVFQGYLDVKTLQNSGLPACYSPDMDGEDLHTALLNGGQHIMVQKQHMEHSIGRWYEG